MLAGMCACVTNDGPLLNAAAAVFDGLPTSFDQKTPTR